MTPYNVLANLTIGSLTSGQLQRFSAMQAWTNEAIVACGIEQYRLAHGALPHSLEELNIDKVPCEVTSAGPLRYKLAGDDNYSLYSVGWVGRDDGAKVVAKDNGSLDLSKSNWVWSLKPLVP